MLYDVGPLKCVNDRCIPDDCPDGEFGRECTVTCSGNLSCLDGVRVDLSAPECLQPYNVCYDNDLGDLGPSSPSRNSRRSSTIPGRFDAPAHAKDYSRDFLDWYNHEHHHVGIGLTPYDVHYGLAHEKWHRRALQAAFEVHPERFPHGLPMPPSLPTQVWINKPAGRTIAVAPSAGAVH